MINYRCDRCGADTTPDKLYEAELVFTPRTLDGTRDTDKADWKALGDLCADCTEVIEPLIQALASPEIVDAGSPPPKGVD